MRLKVKIVIQISFRLPISIPYGAIKSAVRLHYSNPKFLFSIPYGAIKSYFSSRNVLFYRNFNSYGAIKRTGRFLYLFSFFLFQFLMVRLKVFYHLFLTIKKNISIPYGAIKRN